MAHLLGIESAIVGLPHGLLFRDRIYAGLIGKNRGAVIQDMLTKKEMKFMNAIEWRLQNIK